MTTNQKNYVSFGVWFRAAGSIQIILNFIRVKHWIKNAFVLIPLLFSGVALSWYSSLAIAQTFLLFSLCASIVYVINDIFDIEKDKLHPEKKNRALPSGQISILGAWFVAALLASCAIGLLFFVNPLTSIIALAYISLNICYSTFLKHEPLTDVFIIAFGFVLRVLAGSFAIGWYTPHWLLLVTFFVTLFLALGKRRHELLFTDNSDGSAHRPVLKKYNEKLLDYLMIICVTMTIVSYSFYITHVAQLIITIPFVIFGLFRYLHLVYTEDVGGNPTDLVSKDRILIINGCIWCATACLAVFIDLPLLVLETP